jgi:hypothetical protein
MWLTWSIVGKVGQKFWVRLRWSLVATRGLTASAPVAIVIRLAWQRSNVATIRMTTSTLVATVVFVWKLIWRLSLSLPFTKKCCQQIFSTGSSFHSQPCASGQTCTHVYQRTRVVSERRIRWSSKLLDIFEQVILLWVYKVVDMKYNRRGGTKVLSLVDVILSSNGPMPSASPLLLWLGPLGSDWM